MESWDLWKTQITEHSQQCSWISKLEIRSQVYFIHSPRDVAHSPSVCNSCSLSHLSHSAWLALASKALESVFSWFKAYVDVYPTTQTALPIYCIIAFFTPCTFCLFVSISKLFPLGVCLGMFLIPSKVPGKSIHSIMLVHYQINQWPAGLLEPSVLKYGVSWEPLPPVPMETGCCISLNVEHLKQDCVGGALEGRTMNGSLLSEKLPSMCKCTHY